MADGDSNRYAHLRAEIDRARAEGVFYAPAFSVSFLKPKYWGTWLLVCLVWLFAWLPRRAARGLGSAIGWLFHRTNDKRRNIAQINIDWCFPELPLEDRRQLVRSHFRRYGQSIVDLGLIWFAGRRRLLRQVRIDGFEIVEGLLDRRENFILLAPHCSSMDMGGVAWSETVPSTSMMKELDNPLLNWLITRGRTRFGGGMIERGQGIRPLVRMLRAGVPSYYLPDEDFGAQMSVFAPFFGIPTATLPALSRIAKVARARVVPCFTFIDGSDERYVMKLLPPLEDFPSGDPERDAGRTPPPPETLIRLAPDQYMWTLRWFKTRPEGETPPY